MTGTLIRKELTQHWGAMLMVALLSLGGILWVLLSIVIGGQAGSSLMALRLHALLLVMCALVLGNRLVVAEYSAGTQIFLESLPLPRARVVWVKYAIGLATILCAASLALGVAMLLGARTEVYTTRFAGILTARYLCFAFFAFSFFFGMGFLGRYRFMAYTLLIGGVAAIMRLRDVEFGRLPPIELIGETFPFEREQFPAAALAITGGLGLAFFLLSLVLGTVREGSVSSLMGERMSHRDKITLAVLVFGMISAFFVVTEKEKKAPYSMAGGVSAESARIASVTVAPENAAAAPLAEKLGTDLDELADFLGYERMPPLFVVERPDLDHRLVERGQIPDAEGVILRMAYRHPDWSHALCLEHAVGEIVDAMTHRRASKEDRFWVIDGFTLYWAHRGEAADELGRDTHLLLRALYGRERLGSLRTPEDLGRWFSHQQTVGHEITAGIGWSMLRVAERQAGAEAARGFMRSVLGSGPNPSLLGTMHDRRDPVAERFRRHVGMDLEAFLPLWNAELDRWRERLAGSLAALPVLEGEAAFEAEADDAGLATRRLRYRFSPPAGGANGPAFLRPALVYGEPAPFQTGLPESMEKREPLSATEPREGFLRDTWGSGASLCWTFAAEVPALRCRVVSGWRLVHVP